MKENYDFNINISNRKVEGSKVTCIRIEGFVGVVVRLIIEERSEVVKQVIQQELKLRKNVYINGKNLKIYLGVGKVNHIFVVHEKDINRYSLQVFPIF